MLRSGILLLLALFVAAGSAVAELNVYAASSLTDALKEIAVNYEAQGGSKVAYNFAASNVLARQIEESAPADIFFSADNAQMDRLEKADRIENGSRRPVLANSLVVVAPNDSKLELQSPADLRKVQRIAVGDPKFVPVGVYTRAFLEKAGLWKELESKIIPAENVRAGMAVVESGNADVAFVYLTDAKISQKVKIVLRIPLDQGPAIEYPVAIVKDAKHQAEAEKFLHCLTSDAAVTVFEKFQFVVKR
jgi:molybdate transport system substrate-binding protein